jgi:hypothetical protein
MTTNTSTSRAIEAAAARPSRPLLCTWVLIAGIANALVPAVFFSARHLFGPTDVRYRAAVAAMVLLEYAVVFLLLLLHANAPFAGGYAVATAAIVTLTSLALSYMTLAPAGWGWSRTNVEALVLAGLAFAVISNIVFLIASIRYARAIHPRLHVGGFFLGIAASLALLFLYVKILG